MIIYKCNKDTENYLRYAFKITYPDGDEEFWEKVDPKEVDRLENLYKDKLIIEKVTYNETK